MREIKFDAIYKPTGEHFNPININFNDNTVSGNFDEAINDWCHFSLDGHKGDAILRQYTGPKDKNGKEVYEGDRIEEGKSIGTIIYEQGGFEIKWDEPNREFWSETLKYHAEHGEIIGTIYDNPELLKGE